MSDLTQQLESRVIELESKQAFQEDTIDKLNQVITDQQNQLDQLQAIVAKLKDWAKTQQQPNIASPDQEAPPPHY